jgi:hypothetical protein
MQQNSRIFEADDTDNIAIAMAHESRHHESILDQKDKEKKAII